MMTLTPSAQVRVCIDYVRKPSADARDQDERVFASVFQGKENIAEVIVSLGFAEVVKHRMDDERSAHYESLQAAESKAAAAKKGIHGSKPASQPMVDLSEKVRVPAKNPTEEQLRKQRDHSMKTNQFFSSVQRAGKVKAVVEYVFNGGRVKLFVPSMSHIFTFMLAGIRLPSGKGETPNPLAAEVNEFIRSKIFQQDVEVEVQSMEKGGERCDVSPLLWSNLSVGRGELCRRVVLRAQEPGPAAAGTWVRPCHAPRGGA